MKQTSIGYLGGLRRSSPDIDDFLDRVSAKHEREHWVFYARALFITHPKGVGSVKGAWPLFAVCQG